MASTKPKLSISIIQSEFLWVAVACFIFKFYLNTEDAEKTFSTWIITIKQLNGSIMWIMAILSGKKFYDLSARLKKAVPESMSDLEKIDGAE